jgi:hypothetical protein
MTALCVILALSLGALLFSRIHFHFSFNLTISRLHSASGNRGLTPRSRRDRQDGPLSGRSGQMAMGTTENTRRGNTSGEVEAPAVRSIKDSSVTKALEAARLSAEVDLCSALINLGCGKLKALEIAKRAMIEGGRDFDSRLKWAIQKAA